MYRGSSDQLCSGQGVRLCPVYPSKLGKNAHTFHTPPSPTRPSPQVHSDCHGHLQTRAPFEFLFEMNYLGVPKLWALMCTLSVPEPCVVTLPAGHGFSSQWALEASFQWEASINGRLASIAWCVNLSPHFPSPIPLKVVGHEEHRGWHFHLLLAQQA